MTNTVITNPGDLFIQEINVTNIKDSMELNSEETIATLTRGKIIAGIETRGEVIVIWKHSNNKKEVLRTASKFPEELKKLIKEDRDWYLDPRVYVGNNNWFELFVWDNNTLIESILVDIGGFSANDLYNILSEAIDKYKAYKKASLKVN